MVVAYAEYQWNCSISGAQVSGQGITWQAVRYVDNRLVIHLNYECQSLVSVKPAGLDPVLSHSFYGEPICLEPEDGLDFVGVRLSRSGASVVGTTLFLALRGSLIARVVVCLWNAGGNIGVPPPLAAHRCNRQLLFLAFTKPSA